MAYREEGHLGCEIFAISVTPRAPLGHCNHYDTMTTFPSCCVFFSSSSSCSLLLQLSYRNEQGALQSAC